MCNTRALLSSGYCGYSSSYGDWFEENIDDLPFDWVFHDDYDEGRMFAGVMYNEQGKYLGLFRLPTRPEYPFTELYKCEDCGRRSTPKNVHIRYECGTEYTNGMLLCISCKNKRYPAAAALRCAAGNKTLINKIMKEITNDRKRRKTDQNNRANERLPS